MQSAATGFQRDILGSRSLRLFTFYTGSQSSFNWTALVVDAVEHMRALVRDNAAGVIGIEPPLPEAVGVELPPRRGSLPLFPIERAVEFLRDVPADVVVEPPRPDHPHGSQFVCRHNFAAPLKQV